MDYWHTHKTKCTTLHLRVHSLVHIIKCEHVCKTAQKAIESKIYIRVQHIMLAHRMRFQCEANGWKIYMVYAVWFEKWFQEETSVMDLNAWIICGGSNRKCCVYSWKRISDGRFWKQVNSVTLKWSSKLVNVSLCQTASIPILTTWIVWGLSAQLAEYRIVMLCVCATSHIYILFVSIYTSSRRCPIPRQKSFLKPKCALSI